MQILNGENPPPFHGTVPVCLAERGVHSSIEVSKHFTSITIDTSGQVARLEVCRLHHLQSEHQSLPAGPISRADTACSFSTRHILPSSPRHIRPSRPIQEAAQDDQVSNTTTTTPALPAQPFVLATSPHCLFAHGNPSPFSPSSPHTLAYPGASEAPSATSSLTAYAVIATAQRGSQCKRLPADVGPAQSHQMG